MVKKTLVLGASLNPDRYSNMAVKKLLLNNIDVRAVGLKIGSIERNLSPVYNLVTAALGNHNNTAPDNPHIQL